MAETADETLPPFIDEAYGDKLYAEIRPLEVALDQDPLVFGPKRLQRKIEECRRYLNICQRWHIRISEDLYRINRTLRTAKGAFNKKVNHLLANDPETRAGRSVRDREAVAVSKLKVENAEIEMLEAASADLGHLLDAVKSKVAELKDTQGRIRDQITLCRDEIGLGARWGTALSPDVRGPDLSEAGGVDPRAIKQMEDLIGTDGEPSISDLEKFVAKELAASGGDPEGDFPEPLKSKRPPEPPKAAPASEPVVQTAPVVAPAAEPAPVPKPVEPVVVQTTEPEVEAEPEVKDLNTMLPPSSSDDDVEGFFNTLDLGSKPKPSAGSSQPQVTGVVSEIDLDDLIGSLG